MSGKSVFGLVITIHNPLEPIFIKLTTSLDVKCNSFLFLQPKVSLLL